MRGRTVALGVAVFGLAAVGGAFWLLAGGPPAVPTDGDRSERAERPPEAPASAPEAAEAPSPEAPAAPLRGVSLFGRLVRGAPRVPVLGTVTLTVPGGAPRTAASDADGRFLVGGLPPGARVGLVATAEGLLSARHPEVRLDRTGSVDLGEILLGPGQAVEVVAVDRAERPVPGAAVRIHRSPVWRANFDWVEWSLEKRVPPAPETSAATGPDGKATLQPVPPGSWTVVAEAKGFGAETAMVNVEEGRDPGVVRLVLLPGHALRGTVTGAGGKPAAGATVTATSVTGNWYSDAGRAEAATDAAGAYRLEGLREGANQLAVRPNPDTQCGAGTVLVPEVEVYDIRLEEGVTVRGKVLDDAAGTPLAGARVTVNLWGGNNGDEGSLGRAVSGADGAYEVRDLQPGNFGGIAARLEGYLAFPDSKSKRNQMADVVEPGGSREADARLRRGAAVAGRVADAKGAPVRNARVTALVATPHRGVDTSPPALSAEDGSYRLEGLDSGLALLQVAAEGCAQADFPADYWQVLQQGSPPEACSVRIPAEGEARKDLVLVRGGAVKGSASDRDGKPARGLTVTVSASKNSVGGGSGTTDSEGGFRLEGVAPGDDLAVSVWGPKGVHGKSDPFSLAEGGTVEGIKVAVAPGSSLAGRVTRSDGGAPSGCTLRLVNGAFDPQQAWNWQWQVRSAQAHPVAADGAFRIEGLQAGAFTLLAEAPGAAAFRGPKVQLGEAEAKEGVEVVLAEEKPLSGKVVTESGDPVAGARISADDAALRQQVPYMQGPGTVAAVTGAGGEFTVAGTGEGAWLVTADAPGFSAESVTVKGGDRNVAITLRTGGTISGVVVDDSAGAPVADLTVSANPMVWTQGGPQGRSTKTGKDGTFTIRDLKPGEWNVTAGAAWGSEGEHVPKSVAAVKTGTTNLRIVVSAGLAISGSLVDEEGRAVAGSLGIQVQGVNADGTPDWMRQRWAQSDGDGTFRVPGLAPGSYNLQVSSQYGGGGGQGFAPASAKNVAAGTQGLVLTLRKGSPITGKVLDADGKPWSKQAWVLISPSGEAASPVATIHAQVLPDGSFTTPPLDSNRTWDLVLQAQAQGTAGGSARGVAAGTKDVVLQLEKGGSIAGRVLDEDGNPLPKVPVRARAEGAPQSGLGTRAWGASDDTGAFEIAGLGSFRFKVVAGGGNSDWASTAAAELASPGAADVVIRVKKGAVLSGRFVDAAGSPYKPQNVFIVPEGSSDEDGSWSAPAEDGTFTAKGLVPGKVKVRVWTGSAYKDCGSHQAPASGVVITVPE